MNGTIKYKIFYIWVFSSSTVTLKVIYFIISIISIEISIIFTAE